MLFVMVTGLLGIFVFLQWHGKFNAPKLARSPYAQDKISPLPTGLDVALSRALGENDPSYFIDVAKRTAKNEKNGYDISFMESGVAFSSAFTLSVPGSSYADPIIAGNAVTYNRDGYAEWYSNGPLGLEQGFTVHRPTNIEVSISGAKSISLHRDKRGADIVTDASTLSYAGLFAYDANHNDLPVSFVQTSPTTLAIQVDDAHATYPITIDPYVQEEKIALLSGGARNDHFGQAVAISADGTRAIVGAPNADAALIFVRSGTTWTEEAQLIASDRVIGDQFGSAISIDGDGTRVVVGAYYDDIGANFDQGSAYVFTRAGTLWLQEQKLTAEGGVANEFFGRAVSLTTDGARILVGASHALSEQGAAYVFTRSGTTWGQEVQLTASGGVANDDFGTNVAISADGTRAIVGAPGATIGGNANQGAAYVFSRDGTTWSQEQKLTADDGATNDYFSIVSMDTDGTRVVVGAYGSSSLTGAAYVFSRDGTTWSQEQKLTADDGIAGDNFGTSVSISSSGTRIAIGAYGNSSSTGAAYIFTRSGTTWSQEQKLTANDGAAGDQLFSVSITADGSRVLVGALYAHIESNTDQGAAYVFSRSDVTWAQEQKITQPTTNGGYAGDGLGIAVALSADGARALVGASGVNSGTGAAYVFTRSGTAWTLEAKLTVGDGAAGDSFGFSVSLTADGSRAIISAYHADIEGKDNQGVAYIFTRSGTTWSQEAKLVSDDGAAYDEFGYSAVIAPDGTRALVGAHWHDISGSNEGAAYIFTRSDTTWSQETELAADGGLSGDEFGFSVSLDTDATRALIGSHYACLEDDTCPGAAYVFSRDGTAWTQEQKLLAGDRGDGDEFGFAVSLTSDGSRALVGAYYAAIDAIYPGAAYVFSRDGTTWSQEQKLTADDGADGDDFGIAVNLSSDGTHAVVGADYGNSGTGAAYVFTRSNVTWTQAQKLTADDGVADDEFGYGLAADTDGTRILVGAYAADVTGFAGQGAMYVFTSYSSAYALTITKTGNGTGVVTSSPSGIDCGALCSHEFGGDTVVTLTAAAYPGSTFAGWSGNADCADGVVTMNTAIACTAEFNVIGGGSHETPPSGTLLPPTPNPHDIFVTEGASPGIVHALAYSGSTVYLGGVFTAVNGVPRNNLAAINYETGEILPFNPNVSSKVQALVLDGSTLYAGGAFTTVNGGTVTRHYLASFDTATGTATGFDPDPNWNVRSLALNGGTLYAGGDFSKVNTDTNRSGQVSQTRKYLAAFDTTTGTATSFDPNTDGAVSALLVNNSTLYAGGVFTKMDGGTVDRKGVAAFDTATGALTNFNPSVGGPVTSLALDGTTLYVGGAFQFVNFFTNVLDPTTAARTNLAAFDTTTGTVTSFNATPGGTAVHALAYADGMLYAGGNFTGYAKAFSVTNNTAASNFNAGLNNAVNAVLVNGSTLLLGGAFTTSRAGTCDGFTTMQLSAAILTTTPAPPTLPSTPTPSPTPTPLVLTQAGVAIDNNNATTANRYVSLSLKYPFTFGSGVLTRIVNGRQLSAADREVVEMFSAADPRSNGVVPDLSVGTPESFKPAVTDWNLCAGVASCSAGTYTVYAQYYYPTGTQGSAALSLLNEISSFIYSDSIEYMPSTSMPSTTPTPTPTSTPTPTPSRTPTPTPSATPTPTLTPGRRPPPASPSFSFFVGTTNPIQQVFGNVIDAREVEQAISSASRVFATSIATAAPVAAPTLTAVAAIPIAVSGATEAAAASSQIGFVFSQLRFLLEAMGLKRKRRVWGVIYDAKTKRPISYGKVELHDSANRVLETRYTDRDGRYGFLALSSSTASQTALRVSIVPVVPGYSFPSQSITTPTDFVVYSPVYRGEQVSVINRELINYNIPLDPVGPGKTPQRPGGTSSVTRSIFTAMLDIAFWAGIVILPLDVIRNPSPYTISIFVIFTLINGIRITSGFYRPYGIVRDANSGKPLSYALVTLNDLNGKQVTFAVSDEQGRYFLVADPGYYMLNVHTPAQVTPPRTLSYPLRIKRGWVKQKVKV